MYTEIEDTLTGKLPSKWSQEEIEEVWRMNLGDRFSKRSIKKFCAGLERRANLLRHPDPEDSCPYMWVSIFLFTNFKRLPLFINHKDKTVRNMCTWRLQKGK